MTITYRKLTKNDLDIFIKMRIHQLREEGAKDEIDLEPTLRDYYLRHLSDGTFISWLALDNDRIIGVKSDCCQVCLQIKPIEEKASQRHCFQR